jgi:CubicO group peptidase (beta-lactamase class C family)
MRLRDFIQKEIYAPLGMKNSALGMKPGWRIADTVWCYESPDSNKADNERFGANSAYWRDMGHPWGGMHSTTMDLAILLQSFLNGGTYNGKTTNQNTQINKPWGLGWATAQSVVWNYAGDLVSPRAFSHAGATGTVAWADPDRQLLTVILTSRPASYDDGRLLRLVSNAVSASIVDLTGRPQ